MFRPRAIPPPEIGALGLTTPQPPASLRRSVGPSVRRLAGPTENTLIRLAIDLLIANADQLHGSTVGELRRSLGLGD